MKQQDKTTESGLREYTKDVIITKRHKSTQTSAKEVSSWFYLGKAGEIGFTISIPIVAGALVGVYLDKQWSTYPKATLAGIFGGLFISIINFIRLIIELIRTP